MDVAARCPERVGKLVLVSTVGLSWGKPYPMVGLDLLLEGWINTPRYPELVREDAKRVRFLDLCWATYEMLADDFREEMAGIRAPTLVVWGDRDIVTPPRHAETMVQQIPEAELAIIEDAAHTPMWDAPERFGELVLGFLGRGADPDRERQALAATCAA